MTVGADFGASSVRDEGDAAIFRGEPFAVSPRFWSRRGSRISSATQASPLAESGRLDLDFLSSVIAHLPSVPRRSTPFEGVYRVPPDTMVEVGATEMTERLSAPTLSTTPLAATEAAHVLWQRIKASVARAIGDASSVAVMVGGGVDSSVIAAAALEICRTRGVEIKAVTLDYGGEGDDRPYMRALERALDLPTVRLTPSETVPFVRPLLEFAGAPLWAATAATDFGLMARAKDAGAEVVLCGVGGDEIFDGYPRAFGASVRAGDVSALIRAAGLRVPWTSTALGRVDAFVLRPLLATFVPDVVQRGRRRRLHRRRWEGWAGPAVLDYIAREAEAFVVEDMSHANGRYHAYASSSHIADAVEYCLALAELAHVRVAFPFLDRSVVELVASLPPELLMHGGRARGLFRLAARGHVPDVVRLRKDKAHFTYAQHEIFDALGGVDAIADLFSMKASASLGLVDVNGFRAAVDAFREAVGEDEGAYVTWSALWPALSVEGFLRARAGREATC